MLVLFLVTAAVYQGVLANGFVAWDDDVLITNNPHLHGLSLASLKWMFTDTTYVWRYLPLSWLTWFTLYDLGGLNPRLFHAANYVFHGLNTGLLFLCLRRLLLFVTGQPLEPKRHHYLLLCCALGALVWGLHPLRVEPVSWASALIYCQTIFFVFLTVWAYLCAQAAAPASRARARWYWLAVAAYTASLLTYPLGLGLAPVLVVLDVYPLRRWSFAHAEWRSPAARRAWLEKIPFVAAAGLVLCLGLLLRFKNTQHSVAPVSLADFTPLARAAQASYVWVYYLWKPWLPFGWSPLYTQLVKFSPFDPPFILSGVTMVALTAAVLKCRARWPLGLALWVFHLVMLLPMAGLTEHPHFPSDRYSMIVGVEWAVLAAAGLWQFAGQPRARSLALAGCGALLLIQTCCTENQIKVWRNDVTLFRHMLSLLKDSDSYRYILTLHLADGYLDPAIIRQPSIVWRTWWRATPIPPRPTPSSPLPTRPRIIRNSRCSTIGKPSGWHPITMKTA